MNELNRTEYPLRQIAKTVIAVLVSVNAALITVQANVDWAWIQTATTALSAASGIIAAVVGLHIGENYVWPDQKVQAFIAHAATVEPGVEAVRPLVGDVEEQKALLDLSEAPNPDDLPDLVFEDVCPPSDG